MTDSSPYFMSEPVPEAEFIEVDAYDTVVVTFTDYPMHDAVPAL